MNTLLLKMLIRFQDFRSREEGQDMVEYALVIALIAFGAAASFKALATGLNTAFRSISTNLSTYTG